MSVESIFLVCQCQIQGNHYVIIYCTGQYWSASHSHQVTIITFLVKFRPINKWLNKCLCGKCQGSIFCTL